MTRRSIGFPLTVGIVLTLIAVSLAVGWQILVVADLEPVTRGLTTVQWLLIGLGSLFFILIIVGLVLLCAWLVREMRVNQRQQAFLDAVTHEMKTPLASMRLFLETLGRHDVAPDRRRAFLARMEEDVERLEHTVSQVLAAARAEGAGYDVMLCADHLGALSPTVALASVAQTTDRLRLCALVLNNDFRHPALVAQEAATIDLMSGGRYELGIGAGWNIPEYAESGIEFDRAGARIARMGETMEILERLFAGGVVSFSGEYYTITDHQLDPQPPQGSALPMLVGGNGPKVLGVAARHADIIGLTGISMTPEGPELSHLAVPAIGERIAYVRDQAGARGDELEFNALVQHVDVLGDDPLEKSPFFQIGANVVHHTGPAVLEGVDEVLGVTVIKARIGPELFQAEDAVGIQVPINALGTPEIRDPAQSGNPGAGEYGGAAGIFDHFRQVRHDLSLVWIENIPRAGTECPGPYFQGNWPAPARMARHLLGLGP